MDSIRLAEVIHMSRVSVVPAPAQRLGPVWPAIPASTYLSALLRRAEETAGDMFRGRTEGHRVPLGYLAERTPVGHVTSSTGCRPDVA